MSKNTFLGSFSYPDHSIHVCHEFHISYLVKPCIARKWLTSKFEHPGLDPEAELKGPWPCICSRPWVWRDCWETAMVGRWFLLSSHWAPQGDQQLRHWALLGPLGHIGTSAQLLCSKTCWRIHYWCIWPFSFDLSHSDYRHCRSPHANLLIFQKKGPR